MSFLALDTETTGLNVTTTDYAFCVTACDDEETTFFYEFPVDPITRLPIFMPTTCKQVWHRIKQYDELIFHNTKFDLHGLRRSGCIPARHDIFKSHTIHDTAVCAHVLGEPSKKLKDLSIKYLEFLDTDETELKKCVTKARAFAKSRKIPTADKVAQDYWLPKHLALFFPEDAPSEWLTILERYAVNDAIRTAQLWPIFSSAIDHLGFTHLYDREMEVTRLTLFMESQGILFRQRKADKVYAPIQEEMEVIQTYLRRKAGRSLNLNSNADVGYLLYDVAGLPVTYYTPTGIPATHKDAIKKLIQEHPRSKIAQEYSRYRNLESARRQIIAYSEASQYSGAVHTQFNTVGPRTTRFSSSNPNVQNIAKRAEIPLRACFGPRPGHYFLDIDYDQLELRIFAVCSGDENIITALASGDMHQQTADIISAISGTDTPRSTGKTTNFAWIYGASPKKLARLLNIDGNAFNDLLSESYPGAVEYMQRTIKTADRQGYVETLYGYRIPVDRHMGYKGVNYIVQGSAGDLLKNALIRCYNYLEEHKLLSTLYPVVTVHDQIVFEYQVLETSPADLWQMAELMKISGDDIGVYTPVEVDIIRRDWSTPTPFRRVYPKSKYAYT